MTRILFLTLVLAGFGLAPITGCTPPPANPPTEPATEEGDADHAHEEGDEHDHEHDAEGNPVEE